LEICKESTTLFEGDDQLQTEFSRDQEGSIIGFYDADWIGNLEDRRSVTGYIFNYQNGSISWASKKQPTIAISTTEAEYMSLAAATQESYLITRFFLRNNVPEEKTSTDADQQQIYD